MFEEKELEQYLSEAPTIDQKKAMGQGMFAYAPTSDPATWMLPLGPPGSKEPTAKYCGMAAAAALGDGFRGKKANVPEAAKPAIKRKIRSAYRKCGVPKADWPDYVRESLEHSGVTPDGQIYMITQEDETPINLLSESIDLGGRSFDEFTWDLECALSDDEVFPGVYMVWVYKVWDGQVLVGPGGSQDSYLVPYTVAEGEFVFGDPVKAEHVDKWVPKVEPDEGPAAPKPTLSAEERWSSVGKAEEITESVGSLTERHEIVESCMVVLESKGLQENGDLKIEGICGRFDDNYVNANGRLYERKLADSNLPKVNERAKHGELSGLSGHPSDGQGAPHETAFKYCAIDGNRDAAWLDESGFMHFTGYIIPTTYGKDLIVQAERGMAIPFSWRGIGSEEIVERNGRKIKKVCEDYELITWDAVKDASCAGTGVTAIKEEVTMPGSGEATNEGTPQTTLTLTEEQLAAHLEAASKKGAESVLTERDLKEWVDHKDLIVKTEVDKLIKAHPKLEQFRQVVTGFVSQADKREDLPERIKRAEEAYGPMVSDGPDTPIVSKGQNIIGDRLEANHSRMVIPEGRCQNKFKAVERPRTVEGVIDALAEGLGDNPLDPSVVRMLHRGERISSEVSEGLMGNSEYAFRVACNNYKNMYPIYLESMTQEGAEARYRRLKYEYTGSTDIAAGAPFVLPLVRDLWPRVFQTGLWGTQVIQAPTGKVFFVHYQTDPGGARVNTAGSGDWDTEECEQPPSIKLVVEDEDITVEDIGISYEWKLQAEQDIRAYHNIDIQPELLGVARAVIGETWMWKMIAQIMADHTGLDEVFGTEIPAAAGYSEPEWAAEVFRYLVYLAGQIGADPDVRFIPNTALVGPKDSYRFSLNSNYRGWAASANTGFSQEYNFGVRELGTWDGQMKVIAIDRWSDFYDKKMIIGYAGNTWLEQAAVMCVYIPLYIGPIIETLAFDRGQALLSRGKAKVVRPKNYGTLEFQAVAGTKI